MPRIPVVVLVLVLLLATAVGADGPQTGTIDGRVTDASDQALPGVAVTLESDRGEQTAVTDQDGTYRFGLLPPGPYRVQAVLEGLDSGPVAVRLETGQRRRQDLQLRASAEAITVVAEALLVNKYDVGASTSIGAEVLQELPLTTRNYQSATTMLPGAAHQSSSAGTGDSRITYNSTLWRENGVFIDGVDVSTTSRAGSSVLFLPTSALTEVHADTSGYGAEYGRSAGGLTSVQTKSGTNAFHGEFLYVAQNPKWRAESKPLVIPREDDTQGSFEASFGGPIKRDRAWFFLARGETSSNELEPLRDGTLLEGSLLTEPFVVKINVQASNTHALSGTFVDIPTEKSVVTPAVGDLFSVPSFEFGGDFFTGTWHWSVESNKFLEMRGAIQNQTVNRQSLMRRELDPSQSPHTPLNSPGQWFDLLLRARFNFVANGSGEALEDNPRDQVNAAFSWFLGQNELKFGTDFQDISWETENFLPFEFRGTGYNPELPGGFASPLVMRDFVPAEGAIVTSSKNTALFAQNRVSWGEHWTATVGLRLEEQTHDNDIGREVSALTSLAPRLAAAYDVRGDGRFLLKGTLGRYYQQIPEEVILNQFGVKPSGVNEFDEFAWNPATERYDRFLRHFSPTTSPLVAPDLDPYFKDEATASLEWQFNDTWAFEARGIWWDMGDIYWSNEQIDGSGNIFRQLENSDKGQRDYLGLQLELNRSFRSGWVLRANYTVSKQEGNVYGNPGAFNGLFNAVQDDFLEARSVINPASGIPYTAENAFGRGPQDRTHVLNLTGARVWEVGRHTLSLGGLFWFRTGEPWGRQPFLIFAPFRVPSPFPVVVVPGLRGSIQSTQHIEPRDANELPDTMSLNLTGSWSFPLGKGAMGNLRLEVANITDEQEQTFVNFINGQPLPLRLAYQFPREFRLLAGVRF